MPQKKDGNLKRALKIENFFFAFVVKALFQI